MCQHRTLDGNQNTRCCVSCQTISRRTFHHAQGMIKFLISMLSQFNSYLCDVHHSTQGCRCYQLGRARYSRLCPRGLCRDRGRACPALQHDADGSCGQQPRPQGLHAGPICTSSLTMSSNASIWNKSTSASAASACITAITLVRCLSVSILPFHTMFHYVCA